MCLQPPWTHGPRGPRVSPCARRPVGADAPGARGALSLSPGPAVAPGAWASARSARIGRFPWGFSGVRVRLRHLCRERCEGGWPVASTHGRGGGCPRRGTEASSCRLRLRPEPRAQSCRPSTLPWSCAPAARALPGAAGETAGSTGCSGCSHTRTCAGHGASREGAEPGATLGAGPLSGLRPTASSAPPAGQGELGRRPHSASSAAARVEQRTAFSRNYFF